MKSAAEKYQVQEYVYYCIYYANEIFQNTYLEQYLASLETLKALKLLDCYGLTDSERKKWKIPFLERLFDPDFKTRFLKSLSEEEIQKIKINKQYM